MGFAVTFDAVGVEYLSGEIVVILSKQLTKSLTPVEEEALSLLIGANFLTGKGWKP